MSPVNSSARNRLTRVSVAAASVIGVAAVGLIATPPAALAGTCSSKTGGSSDTLMWTGSKYTCAYRAQSGKKKIGGWATQSWTSSTAKGYDKRFDCKKQSGNVSISKIFTNSAGTGIGSSITFTASNSATSSRHWGAGVIWYTPDGGKVADSQYDGCGSYEVKANRFNISKIAMSGPASVSPGSSASYSVTVSAPDGGGTPTGTVALMRQVDPSKQDPPKKNCSGQTTGGSDVAIGQGVLSGGKTTIATPPTLPAGTYNLYAVYGGSPQGSNGTAGYCLAPPQDGFTPAQLTKSIVLTVGVTAGQSMSPSSVTSYVSDTDDVVTAATPRGDISPRFLALRVKNRSFTTGAATVHSDHTLRCPKNWLPVQANVSSPDEVVPENFLKFNKKKVKVRPGLLPAGTEINVQVVCRHRNAPAVYTKGGAYGSAGDDNLQTRSKSATIFGGLGDDNLIVNRKRGVAFGGPGDDNITVRAQGIASGGPGNDSIVAERGGKVLLIGGAGKDRLVGAKGKTLINAVDGKGGDTIVCRSPKNRVIMDKGDRTSGPCTIVRKR